MKRYSIIAAVIVVVALVVVPAAFAGHRPLGMDGYTPISTCTACHGSTVPPASDWAQTAHASVANNTEQSNRATCAGCHSGNFEPADPIAWDEDPGSPAYGVGLNPSEARVACSSCHYNGVTTHVGSAMWNVGNPDFSPLAYGQFANPDVCGQCHDQRSQAKEPYPVYNAADPLNPTMTILRFWPPYNPYDGTARTDVMNIGNQLPLWTGGYAKNVHDTGAVQYDEMLMTGGHFESLDDLKAAVAAGDATSNEAVNYCGHCMSADQRILVDAGKLNVDDTYPFTDTPTDSADNPVTLDDLKYGVSCVACHDPHKRGVSNSAWGGEFEGSGAERNAQLRMPRKDLCGSCHNGHLADGATAFAPGAFIAHPTQEFMEGRGAPGVPQMPALHKGLCVQCHMAPTATNSSVTANHVFRPVMPETAMHNTLTGGTAIAGTTGTGSPGASQVGNTVTISTGRTTLDWSAAAVGMMVTISGVDVAGYNGTFAVTSVPSSSTFTYENPTSGLPPSGNGTVAYSDMPTDLHMPNSACSTCHEGTNGDNLAKTEALQEIIDQRQEWTHAMIAEVMATLDAKAVQMGFDDAADAMADPEFDVDSDFGKAYTNAEIVHTEGSHGVHNWQYGVAILNKAMEQADAYRVPVAGVSIAASRAEIQFGSTVNISGQVILPAGGPPLMAGDTVRLWINGAPANFATLSGNSYTFTGIKPTRTTKFAIQFMGDTNYAPTIGGDTITVGVRYRVTLRTSKTSVTAGSRITLSGTVAPAAGPVTIQRQVNGVWRTFKSGLRVDSKGQFTYTFAIKKGSYTFRAQKAASTTLLMGFSGFPVRVTAR